MYVLKSLNVCELVAGFGGLFSIHYYNIISDSSHSTVEYFAGPSFWFVPQQGKKYHCSIQRFKLFTFVNYLRQEVM